MPTPIAGTARPQGAPQTNADRAFELIEGAIVLGQLAPGQKVTEAALSAMFDIGRGPLREALHRLEGRGVVVRTPHSGIRIVEFSPEDVLEIFEVREALEGMAARLAARNADAEDVAWLERVLEDHLAAEELKMNAGYYQSAGQYDFHFAVIQISGNAQLIRQCDNIYYPLRMFRYLSSQVDGRARAAHAEHARIIAAIREGDGERAEMRMRDHVRESRATFEKRLSRERADGPRPVAETTRGGHAHEPAEQRRRGA